MGNIGDAVRVDALLAHASRRGGVSRTRGGERQ